MIRRILVPLDGSDFGEYALVRAMALAKRSGATLDLALVHEAAAIVYLEGVPLIDAEVELEGRQADRIYLDRILARVSSAGVPATATLLDGPTVSALERHAEEIDADLIVMTTHGRGPLSRAWLGSVADGLARHTPLPLLLIRPAQAADGEAKVDLSAPAAPLRRVLLPVDDVAHARGLLSSVSAVAGDDATVIVMHALSDPVGGTDEVELRGAVRSAEKSLDSVLEDVRAQGHGVRLEIVPTRDVAASILEVAARERVDLIALTTHGHRAISRLVFGSVTDEVLRSTPVPVLIRKPVRAG